MTNIGSLRVDPGDAVGERLLEAARRVDVNDVSQACTSWLRFLRHVTHIYSNALAIAWHQHAIDLLPKDLHRKAAEYAMIWIGLAKAQACGFRVATLPPPCLIDSNVAQEERHQGGAYHLQIYETGANRPRLPIVLPILERPRTRCRYSHRLAHHARHDRLLSATPDQGISARQMRLSRKVSDVWPIRKPRWIRRRTYRSRSVTCSRSPTCSTTFRRHRRRYPETIR